MIDRLACRTRENLFTSALIKVRARQLGISEIDMTDEGGSIEFTAATVVEPAIVNLIQSDPLCYSLSGSGKLSKKIPAHPLLKGRVRRSPDNAMAGSGMTVSLKPLRGGLAAALTLASLAPLAAPLPVAQHSGGISLRL